MLFNLNSIRVDIKKSTALLLCIVCAGLVLRLYCFNGLHWDDDPDYVARVYQILHGQQFIYTDNNGFRVGTYYPAVLTYALFGINDFGCGTYALIVSLLSIIAVYKLGNLLFNERTGLVAALLLTFYPLDVELASRLMPDGLLSGFSLFALYFLFRGDMANLKSQGCSLLSWRSYIFSGLLLGWCTLVNMSAVVVVLFVAVYCIFSLFVFWSRLKATGLLKGFLKIFVLRYALILAAFLLVAGIEGACYYTATGDFLFKYHNTLSHYANPQGFNKDLTMFPRIMFHASSISTFEFQGWENSYYGFYFLALLPAIAAGLCELRYPVLAVLAWLLFIFCYMQWGSMSFTTYIPFHRLPRHLSLVTPPMILLLAWFLANLRPTFLRRLLAPLVVAFLVITSCIFCYYRHQSLKDDVVPQQVIHNYLQYLQPRYVYALNNTMAYQLFLDKFQEVGRQYLDIRAARNVRQPDAYAVVGEFRNWTDAVREVLPDPAKIPDDWQLHQILEVPGLLGRPSYRVKIFKLVAVPADQLELHKIEEAHRVLQKKFPGVLQPGVTVVLGWESGKLDGVEEVVLTPDGLTLNHLQFNKAEDVSYKMYASVFRKPGYHYRILKELGRGEISITQHPSAENNYCLKIRIDDEPYPSHDYYRFFVIAERAKKDKK